MNKFMKKFYLIFAFLVIASGLRAQTNEEKLSLFKYAVEMFNESKYDIVIKNCDAIANRGGDAETYKLRARAYRALGDFNNAIKDYTNAISGYILQTGKKEPTLYFDRGMLYMCQKKFDYALVDFNDARRLFRQTGKENFLYLEEIGRCSHYREENKSAIETFKLAMQMEALIPAPTLIWPVVFFTITV
jgi:tetratricopeptide (TPR) repeat protein